VQATTHVFVLASSTTVPSLTRPVVLLSLLLICIDTVGGTAQLPMAFDEPRARALPLTCARKSSVPIQVMRNGDNLVEEE